MPIIENVGKQLGITKGGSRKPRELRRCMASNINAKDVVLHLPEVLDELPDRSELNNSQRDAALDTAGLPPRMPLHKMLPARSPRWLEGDASYGESRPFCLKQRRHTTENPLPRPTQSSLLVSWSSPVIAPRRALEGSPLDDQFPSLELALDGDTPSQGGPARLTPTNGPKLCMRMKGPVISSPGGKSHAPQLRIRPFTSSPESLAVAHFPKLGMRIRPVTLLKKNKMPSPLARRGAAEWAYLQGQLRAESLRRRKQEQHNAERKVRQDNASDTLMMRGMDGFNDKNAAAVDGQIQMMIEKFKLGFADLGGQTNHTRKALAPNHSSPPTILKRSFKRSVSAVLADSEIAENENLLFFPSGVPLLVEEDEIDGAHDVAAVEGSVAVVAENDGVSHNIRLAPEELSTSDDDSPSLLAADVFWQLGTYGSENELAVPNPLSKKVTLRPKMNAPNNSITNAPQFLFVGIEGNTASTSIDGRKFEGRNVEPIDDMSSGIPVPCTACNGKISHDENPNSFQFGFLDGETHNATESFKQLSSFTNGLSSGNSIQFMFSSPEAQSSHHQIFIGAAPTRPTLSFDDFSSDYHTPNEHGMLFQAEETNTFDSPASIPTAVSLLPPSAVNECQFEIVLEEASVAPLISGENNISHEDQLLGELSNGSESFKLLSFENDNMPPSATPMVPMSPAVA